MKNHILTLAGLALALSTLNTPPSVFAQGSLTPPGPPGPMMKTLAQVEPRTPISALPYIITIPGSYYLTMNLTNPGVGNGITISSGDVTLDLNGFTLQGIPTSADGIYVSGSHTNLVIRNGTVTGWGSHGLDAWSGGYPRNLLFEKLTLSNNGAHGLYTEAGSIIKDCIAIANAYSGFFSQGGELIGCLARENNSAGFTVINASLLHCSSQVNPGYGFYLTASRALDCDSQNNLSPGVLCAGVGCEIRRCRVASNGNSGIFCDPTCAGVFIEGNNIANNSIYGINTGGTAGAYIVGNHLLLNTSGGIMLSENNDYVENNHVVTSSGVWGIQVSGSSYVNNVVVRNVVIGGGSTSVNYNSLGFSDVGPIGSAASASNPWANISH